MCVVLNDSRRKAVALAQRYERLLCLTDSDRQLFKIRQGHNQLIDDWRARKSDRSPKLG